LFSGGCHESPSYKDYLLTLVEKPELLKSMINSIKVHKKITSEKGEIHEYALQMLGCLFDDV
jgi:hypothetical protein